MRLQPLAPGFHRQSRRPGRRAARPVSKSIPRLAPVTHRSTSDIIASGVSELGTVAFTEPLIDAFRDNPPIIVGGSGLMGIAVMARPEITDAEPHATRLARNGAVMLSDGTELWGNPFPDTVLVATARFLESRPEHVSANGHTREAAGTTGCRWRDKARSIRECAVHQ